MSVNLSHVAPGLNPGGLWVRLCTTTVLLAEHALDSGDAEVHAAVDGELAGATADMGERVWCYVYDGDDGRCLATIITGP